MCTGGPESRRSKIIGVPITAKTGLLERANVYVEAERDEVRGGPQGTKGVTRETLKTRRLRVPSVRIRMECVRLLIRLERRAARVGPHSSYSWIPVRGSPSSGIQGRPVPRGETAEGQAG